MTYELTTNVAVDEVMAAIMPDETKADDPVPTATVEEVPDGEESDEEVDDAAEGEAAAEDGDPEGEADDLGVEDLAEYLGVTADDLDVGDDGGVLVAAKVKGEVTKVPLKEMQRSYQIQKVQDEKAHELNQGIDRLREEKEASFKHVEEQIAVTNGVLQQLADQLTGGANQADLDRLRVENPGEYSAQITDLQRRQQGFQTLQQQLTGAWQQQVADRDATAKQAQQQRLATGQQKLEAFYTANPSMPDIRKEDGAKKVMAQLAAVGFSEDEVKQSLSPEFTGTPIIDYRHIQMAARSAMLDDIETKAKPQVKKMRRIKRTMKPGSARSEAQKKQTHAMQAQNRFHKTNSKDDAAELLVASGLV